MQSRDNSLSEIQREVGKGLSTEEDEEEEETEASLVNNMQNFLTSVVTFTVGTLDPHLGQNINTAITHSIERAEHNLGSANHHHTGPTQ